MTAHSSLVTVSAQLYQPTSPATRNWWRGTSLPRPGITLGLNTDPSGRQWDYVAQLRGDPDLGPYGFVAYRGNLGHDEPRRRVAGSFDGATYRLRFPVTCIGSPERVRFTAYVQLYNDTADGIIGGEYARPGTSSRPGCASVSAAARAAGHSRDRSRPPAPPGVAGRPRARCGG